MRYLCIPMAVTVVFLAYKMSSHKKKIVHLRKQRNDIAAYWNRIENMRQVKVDMRDDRYVVFFGYDNNDGEIIHKELILNVE